MFIFVSFILSLGFSVKATVYIAIKTVITPKNAERVFLDFLHFQNTGDIGTLFQRVNRKYIKDNIFQTEKLKNEN